MTDYRVEFTRSAKKALDALPKPVGDRITIAIAGLSTDPRGKSEELKLAQAVYRPRVGQYRVIFELRDEVLIVLVVRIAKRDEATYRNL